MKLTTTTWFGLILTVSLCQANIVTYQDGLPDPFLGGSYAGTRDTFVVANAGSGNQNGAGILEGGQFGVNPRRILLGFDITSLAGNYSAINSVTLRLFQNASDGDQSTLTFDVFGMAAANGDWTEAGATGATKDGATNWDGSFGAGTADTDYITPEIATAPATFPASDGTQVDFAFSDLTLIPTWASGTNHGLLLRATTETASLYIDFFDSEGAQTTRPALIIDYTPTGTGLNVDFGAGQVFSGTRQAPNVGTTWNGINDGAAGGTFGSLVDSNNNALTFAGVSIITTASQGQDSNPGFGDELMNDNNYTDNRDGRIGSSTVTIDGLPVGGLYDLYLYGDDSFIPGNIYGSVFTVTDANGSQQETTVGSSNVFVYFASLEADANGQIIIGYTTNGNSPYGYLNGLQLVAVPEPSSLMVASIGLFCFGGLSFRKNVRRGIRCLDR